MAVFSWRRHEVGASVEKLLLREIDVAVVTRGLGRSVRLPDAGAEPGRYWLRDEPSPTQLSTAEALMGAVVEHAAPRRLRLHFGLRVYAMLRARGRREMAERYRGHSPLLIDAPGLLDRLPR